MGRHLAAVLLAALRPQGKPVPPALRSAVEDLTPDPEHERIAAMLASGELRLVLLGALARRHPAWSEIHALAAAVASATGARLGFLPEGGNAVGAALAGTTPHRDAGGRGVVPRGLSVAEMLGANLGRTCCGRDRGGGLRRTEPRRGGVPGGLRPRADTVCRRGTARD
jgi:NADH-quinone oxidoreductase subunit G